MQHASPRYFLDLDYVAKNGSIYNFEDAQYSYKENEWVYLECHEEYNESNLANPDMPDHITEDEERRVALDYEREEHHKNSLYKKIGIF